MRITNLFFILFLTGSLASFGQTSMTLTSQEQALSQQFKTTTSSERTLVFGKLKRLIVTISGNHTNSATPTVFSTKTESNSLSKCLYYLNNPNQIGFYSLHDSI